MGDFKSEYRRAVDRLEPDNRLLESLKADMKAAENAPPKPNFFVRYRWVFGSAAACLVMALAVGVFLTLGRMEEGSTGGGAMYNDGVADNAGAAMEIAQNQKPETSEISNMEPDMEMAADAADDAVDDSYKNAGYGAVVTTSTTAVEGMGDEPTEAAVVTTTTKMAGETIAEAENGTADIYQMLYAARAQIEELKALSYEELKALVTIEYNDGLTLEELDRFYYVDTLNLDGYYVFMRYDYNGVSCPVAAVFRWMSPEDKITSLRLYLGYDESDGYLDLRRMSPEDIEYYFGSYRYSYSFGGDDVDFDEEDLEQLTPITDEQFLELANKAGRGTPAFSDFEKLDIFFVGFSSDTYTFACTYRDAATEREYFLISHFPDKGYNTAPDYLILRRRRSEEELDLLNEHKMLDSFLGIRE